jgi:hypothetical protein
VAKVHRFILLLPNEAVATGECEFEDLTVLGRDDAAEQAVEAVSRPRTAACSLTANRWADETSADGNRRK